jgi:hypothetical protein
MAWWLVFAVFLYLACAVLIIAEVFVPSGKYLRACLLDWRRGDIFSL